MMMKSIEPKLYFSNEIQLSLQNKGMPNKLKEQAKKGMMDTPYGKVAVEPLYTVGNMQTYAKAKVREAMVTHIGVTADQSEIEKLIKKIF